MRTIIEMISFPILEWLYQLVHSPFCGQTQVRYGEVGLETCGNLLSMKCPEAWQM